MKVFARSLLAVLVPLMLVACSGSPTNNGQSQQSTGGNGGSTSSTGPYSIGGSVTGLTGTGLVLQDNLGDNLTITTAGAFTFKTGIASGKTYSVTILTEPASPAQVCSVANASGTATANVTNVQVVCTSSTTATISGQLTGLAGSGLVLQDNGGDNLAVGKNGTFTFATPLALGSAYNVTVFAEPVNPAQVCSVAGGTGTANGNIGNIVVTCSYPTLSIGGSVSGLSGTGLVLQNNGGGNLTVSSNGTFTFTTLVLSGTTYNVTVSTQPSAPAQNCTVTNATGTATSNVTTVQVICQAVFFTVGGETVGLVGTGGGALQNNLGDNLTITGNGSFTFVTPIAAGGPFYVTQFEAPTSQPQGCLLWDYQGLVTADITTILYDCGHNDWLWMGGADTANALGTQGATAPTPPITAVDTAAPGGRRYPATWVDNFGNLWLFGGDGWDTVTAPQPFFLNDMWVYTGTQNYSGGYYNYWVQVAANGSLGPSQRWGAVTWTDASGTLWLFGGQGNGLDFLNDLWSFNTTSKTWTMVSSGTFDSVTGSSPGSYGTLGAPAGGNWPGGRWGATARLDSAGNLWLFGGYGWDASTSSPGLLNDLWELTAGGQWVWLSGSNTINQDGVYGTQSMAAASNVPGGRQTPVSWLDAAGNFWIFGGYNLSPLGQPNAFNDLWEFTGGQWKWVSGSNTVNQVGNYGVEGTAAATNVPGARWASAAWSDAAGRLWLFGGEGFDPSGNGPLADLWEFDARPSGGTFQWMYVKGPSSVNQVGVYGLTPGEVDYPHVINYPGSRSAPGYWNTGGYLWMFGGEGYDSTTASNGIGLLNDLWRYLPYP